MRAGDLPEEHHDKEANQHDADENGEQKDVHSFVGAGWFAGGVERGRRSVWGEAALTAFRSAQRQSLHFLQGVPGAWSGGVGSACINAVSLDDQSGARSPIIAHHSPSFAESRLFATRPLSHPRG